eukprot:Clim_evm17s148 gene=Clim_evmTU17s148
MPEILEIMICRICYAEFHADLNKPMHADEPEMCRNCAEFTDKLLGDLGRGEMKSLGANNAVADIISEFARHATSVAHGTGAERMEPKGKQPELLTESRPSMQSNGSGNSEAGTNGATTEFAHSGILLQDYFKAYAKAMKEGADLPELPDAIRKNEQLCAMLGIDDRDAIPQEVRDEVSQLSSILSTVLKPKQGRNPEKASFDEDDDNNDVDAFNISLDHGNEVDDDEPPPFTPNDVTAPSAEGPPPRQRMAITITNGRVTYASPVTSPRSEVSSSSASGADSAFNVTPRTADGSRHPAPASELLSSASGSAGLAQGPQRGLAKGRNRSLAQGSQHRRNRKSGASTAVATNNSGL